MRKIATSFAAGAAALAFTVAPLTAFAASPATEPATPSSTEAAQPMHPSHGQWSHRTAVVQEALNSTGANLKIDGVWGPRTEQALKNYQREHNLPVTARLDHETMMRLDPIG